MSGWFLHEGSEHYKAFLTNLIGLYLNELATNYLDKEHQDTSDVLRGRIFMLRELLAIPEQIKSVDKMGSELARLETEGYTKENMPKQVGPQPN